MPFRIMSPHIHRRPLIGVTGPDQGGLAAWCFTWYAIRRAGGRAKRITPRRPCTMKELSGLVIGGGADISPDFYDPNKTPETTTEVVQAIEHQRGLFRSSITWLLYPLLYVIRRIFTTKVGHYGDPARDDLELKLLDEALQLNRPVLGICRGCQLINVHLGGNLHRDIRNFYVEPPPYHHCLSPQGNRDLSPNPSKGDFGSFFLPSECPALSSHRQGRPGVGHQRSGNQPEYHSGYRISGPLCHWRAMAPGVPLSGTTAEGAF